MIILYASKIIISSYGGVYVFTPDIRFFADLSAHLGLTKRRRLQDSAQHNIAQVCLFLFIVFVGFHYLARFAFARFPFPSRRHAATRVIVILGMWVVRYDLYLPVF